MIIYEKKKFKNKRNNHEKTFWKLVTASIAAVTALSVFRGVPTFADTNDDNLATARATGESDAKVAINKTLKLPKELLHLMQLLHLPSHLKLEHHLMGHYMKLERIFQIRV